MLGILFHKFPRSDILEFLKHHPLESPLQMMCLIQPPQTMKLPWSQLVELKDQVQLELALAQPLELVKAVALQQLELAYQLQLEEGVERSSQLRAQILTLLTQLIRIFLHFLNFSSDELILFWVDLDCFDDLFEILLKGYGHYFGEHEHQFSENEPQQEYQLVFMILSLSLFFQL